ncbi:ATP-dependent helicase [Edaphobacter sp. HDX4]|uniref:ATP-dependent helicase n=1 Tax=Edaphobacter sp. HDX4 TaxID=2794064 RepID=UPI002FE4FCD8
MSDASVYAALRSDMPLVVVEAPAGCGKTTSGADYAREIAVASKKPRLLILTHTHAACSVFSERTKGVGANIEIRTIDSVIARIASAYHLGLGLPSDVSSWVRQRRDGYRELALTVSALLQRHPMIVASLAQRYGIVICDEHQDSSGDQHSIVMALQSQGTKLRIFGDPMQKIFRERSRVCTSVACDWDTITRQAHAYEQLDHPHRWTNGCTELGQWTLAARSALKSGGTINLRTGLPRSVTVVFAENRSRRNREYQLSSQDRRPIDTFERMYSSLLILTRHNDAARSLRAFFNRRITLWEGHTRTSLERLVDGLSAGRGDAMAVASATAAFVSETGKGFSPSAFGNRFEQEIRDGCTGLCRGKPAAIQGLARFLVDEPNHFGVAKMLRRLSELASSNQNFADIKIDCHREFWEATRLGDFDSAENAFAEITHRRVYSRPIPAERAISTIHKAKGLECGSVIVMPCDAQMFPDKEDARCLLYVALSRAKSHLMLVVSRNNQSPLLTI